MSITATGETRVNTTTAGSQTSSSIAHLTGGGWIVTWTSEGDIYQQRYAASGLKVGGEMLANTTTAGTQSVPFVTALAGGGWVVTWVSDGDIYQRHYAANGAAGDDVLVNVNTDGERQNVSVTGLADGGWIVAWHSNTAVGIGYDIYQQRYTAGGAKSGGETPVNTIRDGGQFAASVTHLADGGWIVTWQSNGDVYQRRYDKDWGAIEETMVNTTTADSQSNSFVTGLADGGWIVTWESSNQDGDSTGIYQQRFAAGGGKVGGETLVNTTTARGQYTPSVTALADGGWLVVWGSDDESVEGIYQQRYAANGAKVGGETLVNTTINNTQSDAFVTALADGGWIVTWQSNQDGDLTDIYQQRFTADGQKVGPTTPTGLSFAQAVAEGAGASMAIGPLAVEAFDPSQGYSYALLDDAGGRFALSSTGTLTVKDGIRLDYEQARSHVIKVQVKDAPGAVYEQWIEIAVADVARENLTGSAAADILKGGRFKDTFNGAAGNDTLWGGLGNDMLKGSTGKDIFVFDTRPHKSTNRDKIVDFKVKDDTFWLDNVVFTKLGKKGTEAQPSKLNRSYFALETAKDKNDYIVYSKTKGVLYYDADGSGTKSKAVEIATLPKNLKMTYHDFYVI